MQTFLATLALVAFCVVILCFNVYFRKDRKYDETEVGTNKEMRKRGIRCSHEEEKKLWAKKDAGKHPTCSDSSCSDCASCGFYKKEE